MLDGVGEMQLWQRFARELSDGGSLIVVAVVLIVLSASLVLSEVPFESVGNYPGSWRPSETTAPSHSMQPEPAETPPPGATPWPPAWPPAWPTPSAAARSLTGPAADQHQMCIS
jgi:hypothetical protein